MNEIAIIDGDSFLYYSIHPNKVLDENGVALRTEDNKKYIYQDKTEEQVKESADWLLNTLLVNSGAKGYILYVKGKSTISSKLEINPEYKQNRKQEKPLHLDFAKQYFIDKWKAVEVNGIEVDDACNISRLQISNSFIACIDSDLLSLEGTHFNWSKNEWVTTTKEEADYEFWKTMITGSHNGTKGVKGLGEKYFDTKIHNNVFLGYTNYYISVFTTYISHYGEYEGIKQFYSNYICIKILETKEDFILPEINKFEI